MADYDLASRLLHKLALGHPSVGELCFDIELSIKRNELDSCVDRQHVFVSGLARSGTTILMRALHDTGEFASLTYRDMPFVLAPNIWSKIVGCSQRNMDKEVRAHDDGILVDFDSPEALEEVFWRTFAGGSYIRKDKLLPHTIDTETIEKFRDYVSLIMLRYGKSRYLSKNNNNLLRLDSIRAAFPNATVLVSFRAPMQHAYSLLKQHQGFIKKNIDDPFTKKYMGWLAHHEFGSNHRPFEWSERQYPATEIGTVDYWLAQWVASYSAILKKLNTHPEGILLIGYELLCSDTERVWRTLLDRLNIGSQTTPDFNLRCAEAPTPRLAGLENTAMEIYQELNQFSKSALGL